MRGLFHDKFSHKPHDGLLLFFDMFYGEPVIGF